MTPLELIKEFLEENHIKSKITSDILKVPHTIWTRCNLELTCEEQDIILLNNPTRSKIKDWNLCKEESLDQVLTLTQEFLNMDHPWAYIRAIPRRKWKAPKGIKVKPTAQRGYNKPK